MKISELIERLEKARQDYGDLNVMVYTIHGSEYGREYKWHGTVYTVAPDEKYPYRDLAIKTTT